VIASRPVDSFLDLKAGDYVVHVAHGIAKFVGMQTIAKDGKSEEYRRSGSPTTRPCTSRPARINLIQKYVGGLLRPPDPLQLGSGRWEKGEGQGGRRPSWTWRPN
jgi:transcription-repair coupling factor (superfamily II helicase)